MHDGSRNNDDRIEISGVENINPIGCLSAIGVADQTGGSYTGFIRDCVVTDHLGGSAFGASGSRNFKVFNNYARNVAIGLNFDTHPATNLELFGNRLHHVTAGGSLNNGSVLKGCEDPRQLHRNGPGYARRAGLRRGPGPSATVQIYGNRVVQPNSKLGIVIGSSKLKGVFRDNVIRTTGPLDASSVPNLAVFGNCDFEGRSIRPILRKKIDHHSRKPACAAGDLSEAVVHVESLSGNLVVAGIEQSEACGV